MASNPSFAATINVGSGIAPATLDTSLTAPTNVTTVLTPGASGSNVFEVWYQGLGTTVSGVINLFRYDGSTYHLIDQVLTTAVTSSTTALAFRTIRQYSNLFLKSTDTLRFSVTVSGLQSMIKMTAFAGDI